MSLITVEKLGKAKIMSTSMGMKRITITKTKIIKVTIWLSSMIAMILINLETRIKRPIE